MAQLKISTCTICQGGPFELNQILFFDCGHKACRSCVQNPKFAIQPSCHECRQPKGIPRRIFLTLEDFEEEQQNEIIDKLNKIDHESPVESVEKAGRKIRKAQKRSGGDPETLVCLDRVLNSPF